MKKNKTNTGKNTDFLRKKKIHPDIGVQFRVSQKKKSNYKNSAPPAFFGFELDLTAPFLP